MSDLRKAAQQALEFIRTMNREGWMLADNEADMERTVAGLEAALAQGQTEPLPESALQAVAEKIGEQCAVWHGIGARDVEEVLREAVRHGLVHAALAQEQAETEPVAWAFETRHIDSAWDTAVSLKHPGAEGVYMRKVTPLYAAPPQRPPLTDEEIDKASAQERDALLDHIYEYGTAAEGVLERIRKLCRAIERAVRGEE